MGTHLSGLREILTGIKQNSFFFRFNITERRRLFGGVSDACIRPSSLCRRRTDIRRPKRIFLFDSSVI